MSAAAGATAPEVNQGISTDPFLHRIAEAVSYFAVLDPEKVSGEIATNVDKLFDTLTSGAAQPADEPIRPIDADQVATLAMQQTLDLNTSENTRDVAVQTAASAYVAAKETWKAAVAGYGFAVKNAGVTLTASASADVKTFNDKSNAFQSRDLMLFYTMQQDVGQALSTYETTVQAAATGLATAAGALIGAYAAYVTAVEIAETAKLTSDGEAKQAFWAGVEAIDEA